MIRNRLFAFVLVLQSACAGSLFAPSEEQLSDIWALHKLAGITSTEARTVDDWTWGLAAYYTCYEIEQLVGLPFDRDALGVVACKQELENLSYEAGDREILKKQRKILSSIADSETKFADAAHTLLQNLTM